MITSKDVFAKRKEGAIEEAYQMAVQLIDNPQRDDWDIKAYAWCIIDLIKRDARLGHQNNLPVYAQQLEPLEIDTADKILSDQRQYALKLCNPNGQLILKTKTLSKEGRHQDAVNIFREMQNNGDSSDEVQTGLAWELYRLAKGMADQEPPNFNGAKRHLNDYFKLQIEKPSLLHTCFLQLANKLAKEGRLNMGIFVRIWDLKNLRLEDYEPFKTDDGSIYPSLAERVVQHATKDACIRNSQEDLVYIFPFIDDCIVRYPDNIWLKLSKAKALVGMDRSEEALSFGLEVVKSKVNDYWAWELLGDIHKQVAPESALCCYCKALLCSSDINFVGKVKIKLAELLAEIQDYPRAKLEIEEIVNYRLANNQKVSDSAESLRSLPWYETATTIESNREYYINKASTAEEFLFGGLPWTDAILGDIFTIESRPNKPRRKLYVQASPIAFEVSVSESKVSINGAEPGIGIKIKGEYDNDSRYQVYKIEKRKASSKWDIINEQIGVVDHVNTQKSLIHFIVSRNIDGIVQFSDLDKVFNEGDAIAVRLSQYTTKKGTHYHVLTAEKTNKTVPELILKEFEDDVREENGMGFTSDGIFIPPPMMRSLNIKDNDRITGKAILNYNKKRSEWSWKAINIHSVESGCQL